MSRILIRRDTTITEIEIQPLKDGMSKVQMIFLIFGIVGLAISLHQILLNDKLAVEMFLGAWVIVWIFFLIKIWTSLRWRGFGKEIIKITKNELYIIEKAPFVNKFNKFNIDDITLTINPWTSSNGKEFFEAHPGSIKISTLKENRLQRFGKYLNHDDAEIIMKEITNIGILSSEREGDFKISPRNTKEEINPKAELRRFNSKAFGVILIPVFIFNFSLYKRDINKYEILKINGEITQVVSEFKDKWDADYYYYYFETNRGEIIESAGKVGDKEHFKNFYKDLKVIYNPEDPNVYMEYPYFVNYSVGFKVFLYLFLFTFFLSLMGSSFVTWIYYFIKIKGGNTPHNISLDPAGGKV